LKRQYPAVWRRRDGPLARHGITADASMPGSIQTNFLRSLDPDLVRVLLSGKDLIGNDLSLR
jgi:hypothetical protein